MEPLVFFLLGGSSRYREVLNWFYDMNYFEGITNCRVWILEVLKGRFLTMEILTLCLPKHSESEADLEPLLKSSFSTSVLGSSEALETYNGLLGSRSISELKDKQSSKYLEMF